MEIRNIDYNFIRKRLKRLEEAYKQSSDHTVRMAVKDKTFGEIIDRIDGFYEMFGESFEACQMGSLREIDMLCEEVMSKYTAKKLPSIAKGQAKKMLKLKERDLDKLLREYNKAVEERPLTYFSQQIDQKIVFITEMDGELVGTVGQVSKNQKNRESLCPFCNRFRKGDEILFATNAYSGKNGEYSAVGQYFCTDYVRCNEEIEDTTVLDAFVGYSLKKKK